jgi:hypothetical protein
MMAVSDSSIRSRQWKVLQKKHPITDAENLLLFASCYVIMCFFIGRQHNKFIKN